MNQPSPIVCADMSTHRRERDKAKRCAAMPDVFAASKHGQTTKGTIRSTATHTSFSGAVLGENSRWDTG